MQRDTFLYALMALSKASFNFTAGIRQRCPLSPYLFSFVMDALSYCLEDNARQRFEGIRFANSNIIHLLYADNVTVLLTQISLISKHYFSIFILLLSCWSIAKKVAFAFLRVFSRIVDLMSILNISTIVHKFSYLGLPYPLNSFK